MTRNHIILKLQSILLVILLICTVATPASAINTIDNPNRDDLNKNDLDINDINIDDIRKYLNLPESTNPAKLIKTTDGNYFLLTSDSEQAPEYFNWVNNKDTYKIVEDKDGNPVALIPIPYDKKPANAGSCWPFQCVQAIIPAAVVAGAGAYIAAEAIETITIASIGLATANFMNEIHEKAKALSQNDLDKYTFYTINEDTIDNLNEFTYHELDMKKHLKGKLTTEEAIVKMKDCKNKEVKGEPGKTDHKKVIRIFSTEEGCRKIAEYVTKILGGTQIEYQPSKGGKLAHYHPSMPLNIDGKYQHCYSHCYFKEPPHTEL